MPGEFSFRCRGLPLEEVCDPVVWIPNLRAVHLFLDSGRRVSTERGDESMAIGPTTAPRRPTCLHCEGWEILWYPVKRCPLEMSGRTGPGEGIMGTATPARSCLVIGRFAIKNL